MCLHDVVQFMESKYLWVTYEEIIALYNKKAEMKTKQKNKKNHF